MARGQAETLDALARAARLSAFDTTRSWRDALFAAAAGGGWELAAPGEPDRALLGVLAGEYAALDEHAATLPSRLHRDWLAGILGIPRLPGLPDRVVCKVTTDPRTAPAVLPAGTGLRGGKDASGNERRYRTLDTLTAHGATVTGVRVLVPGGPPSGTPGVALSAPAFPLVPPTTDAEAQAAPPAAHVLRIASPALAFASGDLRATLTFRDGTDVAAVRTGGRWRHPRADGTLTAPVAGAGGGTSITVLLSGGCVDPAGGDPWIECLISPTSPVPEGFSFTGVTVTVSERAGIVPDAAYAGDGRVDITKEFEPFAATGGAGDAFYVRCDEAFAKPLDTLTVTVSSLTPRRGGVPPDEDVVFVAMGAKRSTAAGPFAEIVVRPVDRGSAAVWWQRRVGGAWQDFGAARSAFGGAGPASVGAGPGSEPFTVGGAEGRFIRAFVRSGDFGWADYQQQIASFATLAVRKPASAPAMPTPPVAAVYAAITLSYTTVPVAASRVEAFSGWAHTVQGAGAYRPFRRAVDETGGPAMVAVGVNLPEAATGATVSLYLVLDPAAPCGSTEPLSARWEWWDGGGWQPLPVSDGTHGLREAGLLRFVAPAGWAAGCAAVTAASGRWVRFVTDQPTRIGVLRDVVPDAVVAEYVSRAADPEQDTTLGTALPPGAIKGTLKPVRGVIKATNVAATPGRPPESDTAYATRASARARHRGRALTPWDYEQTVALGFPEVADVRCLPHTDSGGARAPGTVGLAVLPDRRTEPAPRPDVSLAGRIAAALRPAMPPGARVAVLCPLYVPVSVAADVLLRPGVAALLGQAAVVAALDGLLHPAASRPARWGAALYASTLVAALERLPEVDVGTAVAVSPRAGPGGEVGEVDPVRGLYCALGAHLIKAEEQL
jgi:hypothetical protein